MNPSRPTNALAEESSPYLKQHAHNPVAWRPWSQAAWDDAKRENKLVLVSIGYAACHWCHVMERECFEKEDVAAVMNRDFICLKIDREERPDVDQVYIEAVQLLSGHAGWPLNCFCLPDGKPIYGVTYQPAPQWVKLMMRLAELWKEEPEALVEQAGKLTEAMQRFEIKGDASDWPGKVSVLETLRVAVDRGRLSFDRAEGGTQRAPKFPLPVNWRFLLRYGYAQKDTDLLKQVRLTLDKMGDGGILDQIGGGFARYSVDGIWKVPHFEKMLYDNGQLLGLYAQGFAVFGDTRYRDIALGIAQFLRRELQDSGGCFFASLDADSEGVEGKFYVWSREEIQSALGTDFAWFADLHCVDERGHWEEGHHILMRDSDLGRIAAKAGLTVTALQEKDKAACQALLEIRSQRVRPGLDDKVLVSWNALAITGWVEAGLWLAEGSMLSEAERAARTLLDQAMQADGQLHRSRQRGRFAIPGFLEDYAHLAWACLQLHRATQDTHWVLQAEKLVEYALKHFSDAQGLFFYFTSDLDAPLVARKMDLQDNVLPSANGVMARCLWRLGELLDKEAWISRAQSMVAHVLPDVSGYVLAHAGWAEAGFEMAERHATISVLGPNAKANAMAITKKYVPEWTVVAESTGGPALPCLQGVTAEGRDLYVLCRDKACQPPVSSLDALFALT